MRLILTLAGIGLWVGCSGDNVNPGVRDECADFGGAGLDCERMPIETIDDMCAKLLGCGLFPLENPDGFDWTDCMQFNERLDDRNRDIVFACVEIASCDELKRDQDGALPPCLQHGDQ